MTCLHTGCDCRGGLGVGPRGVNLGRFRRSRPPDFGLGGVVGVAGELQGRGSCTGLGKYYSLFWTESMLESEFFQEKKETFGYKVGVDGQKLKFLR